MSEVELTKMSSRGQVVIPQTIRNRMHLKEGEALAVTGSGDTMLIKRVSMPSKQEILRSWKRLNAEGRKHVKKLGIKQKDVNRLIHAGRGIKV